MNFTSPFFVVPVIVAVFFACIFWSTGGTADGKTEGNNSGHATH